MSERRASPITCERFTFLFAMATLICAAPLGAGIAIGAIREASGESPAALEIVSIRPAAAGWWRSSEFEPESGRLVARNFSLRDLIDSAYPASIVNADRTLIDGVRYDIEARWSTPGSLVGTSERKTWRAVLKEVVENNSKYEVYVTELH